MVYCQHKNDRGEMMSLAILKDVSKSFGDRVLFENVTLKIEDNTRMGFIGENGAGKSTFFKLLTGKESFNGDIYKSSDLKIGIMEQSMPDQTDISSYEYTLNIFDKLLNMEKELEKIRVALENGESETKKLIERQDFLNNEYIREGGMTFRSRTRSMLMGLGISHEEMNLPPALLSGGQRTRVALSRLLLSDANLLLLDEPTNHLDINAVSYLEDFLKNCGKAFVVISHDRYFLDKVTNSTIELFGRNITYYVGSYSVFMEKRKQAHEAIEKKYENTMKEINRLEAMIELQHRWNRERNIRTAENKQKSIDRLEKTLVKPENKTDTIKFRFSEAERSGDEVLKVNEVGKSFDGKKLFEDVSFKVMRGERVFVIGDNGCGKSTLYRIIKGEIKEHEGKVIFGANVKSAYYDQERSDINSQKSVEDELWDMYPKMDRTEIRNALAAFLFRGDDVCKKVSELSGGEKARLAILEVMLTDANFLILDEPTNHLDINSKEALENALLDFSGTVLIISHDRYLINKMADKIIAFSNGEVKCFNMNYDRYLEYIKANISQEKKTDIEKNDNDYKKQKELRGIKNRLAGKIKRIESEISEKEDEISSIQKDLNAAGSDFEKITSLSEKLESLENEIAGLMETWENLNTELENI